MYYKQCVETAVSNQNKYDLQLIQCLYIGEDKRNSLHFGVDFLGVIRAIWSTINGRVQGASTIEQQYTRTVIGRYERTVVRKVVEQLVSHLISLKLGKRMVAESYLSIAFYGTSMQGFDALCKQLTPQVYDIEFYASVIARLKYPQPRTPSPKWFIKHENRVSWIVRRYNSTNKAFNSGSQRSAVSVQSFG